MEEEQLYHKEEIQKRLGIKFLIGIVLNFTFVLIEIWQGIINNSTSILSYAGHNFFDVLELVFSFAALKISQSGL